MSIRDLFLKSDNKLLSKEPADLRKDAESIGNITATTENRDKFIPKVDFSDPANFANFGSAESYYEDAITRVYENYPYDGSSKERQEYLNESTYIDLWMLENKYPRTTGYIILSAEDGTSTADDDGWQNPNVSEYISFVGGPHTASQGMVGKPISSTFDDSNKYDTDIYRDKGFSGTGTRENNLKTNFDNGVTVEFWFTTEQVAVRKHTVFDLWNSSSDPASYGRINVAYNKASSSFSLTAQSGSSGINEELVGSDLSTLQNSFHHYAIRFYNSGSNLNVDFYVDGDLDAQETYAGESMEEVTGPLTANIGALTSPFVDAGGVNRGDIGWGKLSGSLDEFRFWKTKRTSEEIGRNWFDQVYGGTNTDISNADLGVYFKFNEGITGNSSIDSTVLDYSGRITNGTWTGYNTEARSTGSAIVLANAAISEFQDPIIYPEHPDVQSVLAEMKASGSAHDYTNNSSLYNGFPLWVIENDNDSDGELKKLTQVMSSYLDTLQLQIQELPKLQNVDYYSGSYSKEYPFMSDLLEGRGMVSKDIFADATVLEQIFSRSETDLYSSDLTEVKNLIYRNIYNNISYIYKSKGTEKSFRNLIRCYGIDDSLINLNLYSNNLTYELENTYQFDSEKKRYADFYSPSSFEATVYQQTSSAIANSVSFISASGADQEKYSSFTLEADIILPKKRLESDLDHFSTTFSTSSLFGFHTADSSNPEDFAWPATDYDLKAYVVRPPDNDNLKDAYFLLTSSYFGLNLTSSIIKDAYDNRRWNVNVKFYPEKASNLVSGSSNTSYVVDFSGIQKDLDVVVDEFSVTESVATAEFLTQPKRIYAAAHRQDFSGSILEKTDVKLGFVRYWMSKLSDLETQSHAQDPTNYGKEHPLRGIGVYDTTLGNIEVPQAKTLALDWGWDVVSTSSTGGTYGLLDKSSGSAEDLGRYGWLSNVSERQHTGIGDYNPVSQRVVNVEYIPVARKKNPESLNPTMTSIKVINEFEEEVFDRNTRPVNFYYSLEKSMYSSISKEMLRYFASIVDFNNLIGEPVNRYRSNYKDMSKLRQIFFESVQNEPKVEKFIDYYRWIDESLSSMLQQLVPASSEISEGIRNTIESHVLERNKYRNKFATLGKIDTDLEAGLYGVERSSYPWRFGTPTLPQSPPPTNEHCFWWRYRADRTNERITSGDSAVDATRNAILAAVQSSVNRSYTSPVRVMMKKEEIYGSGLNSSNNNIADYLKSSIGFGSSDGLLFEAGKVKDFIDCLDVIDPLEKKKWSYAGQNQKDTSDYATSEGDLVSPFVAVSSSVTTGYNSELNTSFKQGFSIENLHIDGYSNGELPLQGPFTEKYVGGRQNRHVALNTGTDSAESRPEAWKLEFTPSPGMKIIHQPVNQPRAALYRGLTAKSPLNIANIKTNLTTGDAGNYSKDYEIVQTVSRTKNNVAYTKAEGFNLSDIPSPYIAGMDDYAKPNRGRTEHVFVNRFSSPGSPDTAGDSNGGPALDTFAAEYSPYNNINYRNTTTRNIYKLLHASHVNQFGFYSDNFGIGAGPSQVGSEDYSGTGSIYQTNRNPIKQLKESGATTVTASVYDNYFVQHAIPRSDLQYSWITSSYTSYDTFGYLPYSGEVSSSTGETSLVTFSSASDFISYKTGMFAPAFGKDKSSPAGSDFLPTVYNGLNYNVYEPSDRDTGFLGYKEQTAEPRVRVGASNYKNDTLVPLMTGDGEATILNALLLKRNGPYQHPTWKQIRNSDNPVVRNRRQNGLTAYNVKNSSQNGNVEQTAVIPVNRFSSTKLVKDPAVIGKYKPLEFGLKTSMDSNNQDVTIETVRAECVYGNQIGRFANNQITYDLLRDNLSDKDTSYRAIYDLYSDGKLQDSSSPIEELVYLNYSEQVYPSSINCYSKVNRERIGFKNTFWKDSREERTTLGQDKFNGNNTQGVSRQQSAWGLDAAEQFGETLAISAYYAFDYNSGSAGELQNQYTFFFRKGLLDTNGSASLLVPSPILSRKNEINSKYSVVTPTGMETIVSAATSTVYLTDYEDAAATGPFALPYGIPLDRGGTAKFEAHTLAGYIKDGVFVSSSAKPFYDKYDQYNLEMRLNNKDMSLVPEFRISENIEKYLNDSNGFVSDNESSFNIFGVNQQGNQNISYTDQIMQTETYNVQVGEIAPSSSSEDQFYKIYSFSDFMQYFDVINEDHTDYDLPKGLTLSCKALMKFIPYDGFYPAEHTLEIANAFSQSYSQYIDFTGSGILGGDVTDPLRTRPIYETMFSPGILFNTIKSGVAVDYPVYTGSYDIVTYTTGGTNTTMAALGTGSRGGNGWDYRISFETLLEPEKLNNIPIMDMNVGLYTTRLTAYSDFCSASLDAPSGMNSYKLMMSNFLAEVPSFFLENGMTRFSSNMAKNIAPDPNTTYGLRVKMYRSMNKERVITGDFMPPQDDITDTSLFETMTMYSRPTAFGPPVAGSDTVDAAALQADSTCGINPSFTPPYYNGECWADIYYTTDATASAVTIEDILSSASVNYLRSDPEGSWPMSTATGVDQYPYETAETANKFSMQLSASMNLFAKDSAGNWNIQTKFETPILNFGDKTKRPLSFDNITLPSTGAAGDSTDWDDGYGGQTTTPIGIWHQFGLVPEENQGIYVSVEDIGIEFLKNASESLSDGENTKSLIDLVGFERDVKKLGQVKDTKTVYESVVAVPFREDRNCNKVFFEIEKTSKDYADLESKMNKYVFPPQFDFLRNGNATPLAMYVFEFEHTFDRDDLSHIWQNISPKFGESYKTAVSSISHPLLEGQRLSDLSGRIKWMVFKVKQRARTNYYENLVNPPGPSGASMATSNDQKFSYNWPYDYFSMVEFAKVEASVNFGKEPTQEIESKPTVSGDYKRENVTKDMTAVSSKTTDELKKIDSEASAFVKGNRYLDKDKLG